MIFDSWLTVKLWVTFELLLTSVRVKLGLYQRDQASHGEAKSLTRKAKPLSKGDLASHMADKPLTGRPASHREAVPPPRKARSLSQGGRSSFTGRLKVIKSIEISHTHTHDQNIDV